MIGLITLDNVVEKLTDGASDVKFVYPITKKSHFELHKGLEIELSTGKIIFIKKGFMTDGSSSPRLLWPILPPYGDFVFAAIIHDYLYRFNVMTQKQADEEMLIWSKVINNKNVFRRADNVARFWGVRLFGEKRYNNYRKK